MKVKENINKYNMLKNGNGTFVRDGKSIYNSGPNGKIILHSPSQNKQLFLYKHSLNEIKDISLDDHIEFILNDVNPILEKYKNLVKDVELNV